MEFSVCKNITFIYRLSKVFVTQLQHRPLSLQVSKVTKYLIIYSLTFSILQMQIYILWYAKLGQLVYYILQYVE
jgi:hypothetical protein